MIRARNKLSVGMFFLALFNANPTIADDAVKPGELTVERPTLGASNSATSATTCSWAPRDTSASENDSAAAEC